MVSIEPRFVGEGGAIILNVSIFVNRLEMTIFTNIIPSSEL